LVGIKVAIVEQTGEDATPGLMSRDLKRALGLLRRSASEV
jgi:hypothetical protein